ncbi:protein archease-like isoform X1 [Dreissena polymorpha]|uniref:Archease domain-containing protein n=1 Tax=Dreissena polymorpha TaxID=45954 RepID=A0A9D4HA46_DREPO|nr:protein archease-like isoform X1 [Dreissena polymorpha]XP_052250963.1 protein archease-like isoform X1 [Dreissena polymorpha]KAH3713129.1 hypothetical protein DPMN_072911 [Dreissena polymorpha]KAH3713903.1 hypothetical protein DPMN_073704 [Dreissena polymorpha]
MADKRTRDSESPGGEHDSDGKIEKQPRLEGNASPRDDHGDYGEYEGDDNKGGVDDEENRGGGDGYDDDDPYDDGAGGDSANIYGKYEYLDHTADVQIHAWGDSLKEAFEQAVQAMFNYMTTDFSTVEMTDEHEVEAQGEDLQSLLFHLMDEWLFAFSAEPYFIAQKIEITEFDTENFRIKAKGYGEEFDISKHPQGTEVKAITYSNMQIHDSDEKHEVFVIIDI